MSNFECPVCHMVNIDCGQDGYKTDKEIKLEKECEELHERTATIIYNITGGRLSYSTYTVEAVGQAYYDQLEIDVEKRTKELEKELSKYQQVLQEIKEYCIEQNLMSDVCNANKILIIINEVEE